MNGCKVMRSMASIDTFFEARSVAFVGASPRSGAVRGMASRLRAEAFPGTLWMVNPRYQDVFGVPCYPSLRALPDVPDLVVVAVRASEVADLVGEAASLGVKAALVVSTGFADAGEEGRTHAERLRRVASDSGIALCGPGSFGFANPRRQISPFWDGPPGIMPVGNVAVVAQSGGFANVMAFAAVERGFGISSLVATGSEIQLTASDFLRHALEDHETKVVAAILEEIRDIAGFEAAIRQAAEFDKVVVSLVLGRSAAGQRATAAHSGALASRSDIQAAFLKRLGVVLVNTLDDLVETVLLASAWGSKVPQRLAPLVSTISGGDCSLILDLAEDVGIQVPELSSATQHTLRRLLPESTMLFNPIDLGTRPLQEERLGPEVIEAAAADPAVSVVMTRLYGDAEHLRRVADASARTGKPYVVFTRSSAPLDPSLVQVSRETKTPILKSVDRTLAAVQRLAGRDVRCPAGDRSVAPPPWAKQVTARTLSEAEALGLLQSSGLSTVPFRRAASVEEAVQAANAIGYPVVVKVDSPDIAHKSDVGGVLLDLRGEDQVAAASAAVMKNAAHAHPDADIRGVVVQPMLRPQLELIVGFLSDARFGPAVLIGFGGLLAEVLGRAEVRLAPLSQAEAEEALYRLLVARQGSTKSWRGLDISGAARFVSTFSVVVAGVATLFEAIEVNPLGVFNDGRGVLALDCLMVPRTVGPSTR